jgi:hypothetical protein
LGLAIFTGGNVDGANNSLDDKILWASNSSNNSPVCGGWALANKLFKLWIDIFCAYVLLTLNSSASMQISDENLKSKTRDQNNKN